MRYFEFYDKYLTLPRGLKEKGFVPLSCVLHEDSNASAGVDLTTGVYKCFVCGSFSPVAFLAKLYPDIPVQECASIVDAFRREKGLITKEETFVNYMTINPRWGKLVGKSQEYDLSAIPMVIEYAETRGLMISTLESSGIGWLPAKELDHVYWPDKEGARDALVFPYYNRGKIVGVRYRDEEGSKSGETGCQFCLWGLDDITETTTTCLIVEGESDRLRLKQLVSSRDALVHCAVLSSPTGTFKLEWRRDLEGIQRNVLIPQSDLAARNMIEKAKVALRDTVEVYHLPWKRGEVGKDLCEWLQYHQEEDLALTLEVLAGDQSRRFLTGWEFYKQAGKPRSFVIDHLLARRQIAILGGQPKHKKTWLVMNLIRATMFGEDFCGIPGFTGVGGMKWLVVEEEGDEEELQERASMVFKHPTLDWQDYTLWAHHLGVQLYDDAWIERLCDMIALHDIKGVVLDPLQRMTTGEENSSSDQADVWRNLHLLTTKFKDLTIVLLHHFSKDKEVTSGGTALRGTSRHWAEADLGIFVEKKHVKGVEVLRVGFDGRTLKPMAFNCDGRGKALEFDVNGHSAPDVWDMFFQNDSGLILWDKRVQQMGGFRPAEEKVEGPETAIKIVEDLMAEYGSILITDAMKVLGCSNPTIRRWLAVDWADKFTVSKGKILWRK